jgi:hypothetical protein
MNSEAWMKSFKVYWVLLNNMVFEITSYFAIEYREIYTKHRRSYTKLFRSTTNPTPSINLVASRLQLEKDYKIAVQKQDQKIELTKRMYELVSRHIERLDSQVAKSGLNESDWISQRVRKGPSWLDSTGHRKRTLSPMDGSMRKR